MWENSIIREADVPPAEIMANPENWRAHPIFQRDVLLELLDDVGWVDSVVVNERTGRLIDGHLRVKIALERGEDTIPVTFVDLSEDDERLALAMLDPVAEMALIDRDRATVLAEAFAGRSGKGRQVIDALIRRPAVLDMKNSRRSVNRPTAADLTEIPCSIGPYRFKIPVAEYRAWAEALMQSGNGTRDGANAELRRRLKI